MLCNICSSIDFKRMIAYDRRVTDTNPLFGTKLAFHHKSYTALLSAARDGCELCTAIDEERRADETRANLPIQDMEAIESCWSWVRRMMQGSPGLIYCHFEASMSAISFRRFYEMKHPEPRDSGFFHVNLRIYAKEDSLGATHGISGRPITIDPLSDASLLQMQRWMAECTSNHKGTCQPDSEHTLPTRVIDVYGNSSHDAFLHISEGQKGRWLILSHVWGNKAGYVTDAKNLNAMKTSIPEDKLPKTFQNAIAVTRRLGFQYLWIDSLCILQGETEDWAAEVVHMHEYYKHSSLMIAADAANGDHCGFLQPRPPKYPSIVVPFNFEHKAENHSVFVQRQPPSRKDLWPLFTRGWTLQEDVLSPRTVHFQTHQMTWECQTHKFEELKPYKVDSLKRALLGSSPNSWLSTVGEFSNRDLTFKEDMLPALSAIAKEYQSTSQQTYKAGLWLEDMHRCLLWTPRWRGKRTRQPSWSWASLDVPRKSIRTPTFRVELIKHLPQRQSGKLAGEISEVIDCVVVPEDGDSYGRIQSGSLRMRGPWKEAAEWSGFTPYINPDNGDDGPRNSSLECRREFDPFGQNERSPGDPTQLVCTLDEDPTDFLESSEAVLQHLSLFQILNIRYPEGDVIIALILQSVREEEGTFRRRGIAQVPIVHGHAEVGWKTREVRII